MTSQFSPSALVRAIVLIAALVLMQTTASAALTTSTTDVFEGATVTASTGIGASVTNMFLGADPEATSTMAFFDDNGIGSIGIVDFSTATDINLTGLTLSAGEDGAPGHRRAMNNFRFLADTDGDSTFETILIDQAINIDYSLQPGNAGSGTDLNLTFSVPSTIANSFRAEFTQGASVGEFEGVRVMELDAIGATVPEPQSFALFGITAFALAVVRRRSN